MMPIEDFATKQEVEELKSELSAIKKQNKEVLKALKDLSSNVQEGYIKVRGGEDIPKLSEIQQETQQMTTKMNQYANYVKKQTTSIEKKLESYGNIEEAVKKEAHKQVRPLVHRFMQSEDTKTAEELKQNRLAYLTSIGASLGLFVTGATICIIAILKLL